jgi:hypothetical protein
LIFALDATGSRAPTWAAACEVQAKMFREAAPLGQLDLQLVFYHGNECQTSKWVSSGEQLAQLMNRIECVAGATQIFRVLKHALREAALGIQGLIFIGDAIEGDSIEEMAELASDLGRMQAPIFAFQEGRDLTVQKAFRLLALKSGGEYFEFNPTAPRAVERLSNQLAAIARFAVGDRDALRRIGGSAATRLLK